MYRETASRVSGAVVWSKTVPADAGPGRVLPDGCIDLIWSSHGGLLVAGPDTTAHLPAAAPPGERYVGLRLPPGAGPVVVGVPAHELRNRRLPLSSVWAGALAREIEERAAYADRPGALLESIALTRLRAQGGPDPAGAVLAARLAAGDNVAAAAAALDVGPRQLHRRCLVLFGYGAKTLARILRMQRALALARSGVPAAEVAMRAGYADQPHLSRDVRELAGVPLGALVAR
jgi:AraC-like DNA-binding protein